MHTQIHTVSYGEEGSKTSFHVYSVEVRRLGSTHRMNPSEKVEAELGWSIVVMLDLQREPKLVSLTCYEKLQLILENLVHHHK